MERFGRHLEDLVAAFTNAFRTRDELAEFLRSALEVNIETISVDQNLLDATRAVLAWSVELGRERELLQAARDARPKNDVLQLAVSNALAHLDAIYPEPWYRAPTPYETCILRGRRALFDRDGLRRYARELISDEGANVLVVRGGRDTGRSHSYELFAHLAAESDALKPVLINLRDMDALDPEPLMRHAAIKLGIPVAEMPPIHGQLSSWTSELCGWFVDQVNRLEKQVWLVVDSIDHKRPSEETINMITGLANLAEQDSGRLRVILLGWNESLPEPLEYDALKETLEELKDETLAEFFTSFFHHLHGKPKPELVARAYDTVIELVGDAQTRRLERLSRAAFDVAREFATINGEVNP